MKKIEYGAISIIGITTSGKVSIEFYSPEQPDGTDYETIFLTLEHVKLISKLGVILNGKTA